MKNQAGRREIKRDGWDEKVKSGEMEWDEMTIYQIIL